MLQSNQNQLDSDQLLISELISNKIASSKAAAAAANETRNGGVLDERESSSNNKKKRKQKKKNQKEEEKSKKNLSDQRIDSTPNSNTLETEDEGMMKQSFRRTQRKKIRKSIQVSIRESVSKEIDDQICDWQKVKHQEYVDELHKIEAREESKKDESKRNKLQRQLDEKRKILATLEELVLVRLEKLGSSKELEVKKSETIYEIRKSIELIRTEIIANQFKKNSSSNSSSNQSLNPSTSIQSSNAFNSNQPLNPSTSSSNASNSDQSFFQIRKSWNKFLVNPTVPLKNASLIPPYSYFDIPSNPSSDQWSRFLKKQQ